MPHIELSYSSNLEDVVDVSELCNALRVSCIQTNVAPLAGIRVRAFRCDHYSIADGDEQHGYIDFSIRLREGRSPEEKENLTNSLFSTAEAFLSKDMQTHSIALSAELRDIDAGYAPKTGSIRKFLKKE